jgi:hypothetical protein
MNRKQIQHRLDELRAELDRLDSTGQSTTLIQQEIARLVQMLEPRRMPISVAAAHFKKMRQHVNRVVETLLEDEDVDFGDALDDYADTPEFRWNQVPELQMLRQMGFDVARLAPSPEHWAQYYEKELPGELALSVTVRSEGDEWVQIGVRSREWAEDGTRIGYSFHDSPRYSISRCVTLRKAVPLVTMLLQQIEHLEEREDLLRKDKLEYLDTWIRLNA